MEIRNLHAVETVVCRGTQLLLYKLKCFCNDGMFRVAEPLDSDVGGLEFEASIYFSTNTSSPFSTLRSLTLFGNFS
jgi:hypothetical protein